MAVVGDADVSKREAGLRRGGRVSGGCAVGAQDLHTRDGLPASPWATGRVPEETPVMS